MNKGASSNFFKRSDYLLPGLFFIARLMIFLSLPYTAVQGYGDFWNYFQQNQLGYPFFDYWTEFPPLFPFLSRGIFLLSGGREQAYTYLLALLFSAAQTGTLAIMIQLEKLWHPEEVGIQRSWWYFGLTVGLFYGWSYYDPLTVLFLMVGIYCLFKDRKIFSAFSIALGVLTKWFPLVVLPAFWKFEETKNKWRYFLIVGGICLLVWGGLFLINPSLTGASIASQANKGSWETIWALLDQNMMTGNFGAEIDRLDPSTAFRFSRNPAVISPWITLLFFGGIGWWIFSTVDLVDEWTTFTFIGLTWIVFLLWSPGYSPQWVLYLLPFIFLCFSQRESALFGLTLVLLNLLEWPVLLSRGFFWSLRYIVILRTGVLILVGLKLYQLLIKTKKE